MQTADVRVGTTFEYEGKKYIAVEWQHVCQPRLAAFIRGRIKNIETGQVIERNFKTNEKVEPVQVERKEMQYLYNDGEIYYFMDPETFEQIPVNAKDCSSLLDYLMDNMTCTAVIINEKVASVEPPLFVELEIVECDPAVAGNTATNASKMAKLETGKEIRVPLFVNNHDRIRIDTRTGEYMERV